MSKKTKYKHSEIRLKRKPNFNSYVPFVIILILTQALAYIWFFIIYVCFAGHFRFKFDWFISIFYIFEIIFHFTFFPLTLCNTFRLFLSICLPSHISLLVKQFRILMWVIFSFIQFIPRTFHPFLHLCENLIMSKFRQLDEGHKNKKMGEFGDQWYEIFYN